MTPPQSPTQRRVVLCVGRHCDATGQAKAHFERLKQVLGYPDPFDHSRQVKWTIATCLSHCDFGPNLVIYPEGQWYEGLDSEMLEQVIAQEIAPLLS
jgi:(2Fe-2S) ferredoxin